MPGAGLGQKWQRSTAFILTNACADLLDRSGKKECDEGRQDHKLGVEQDANEPAAGLKPVVRAHDHANSTVRSP